MNKSANGLKIYEKYGSAMYGVMKEKNMYGRKYMGIERSTFIIDENGVVEKVFPKANPDTNAAEILEYLGAGK